MALPWHDTARLAAALLTLALLAPAGDAQNAADHLRVGHWVRAKGHLDESGRFQVSELEVREPERYESLVGTVSTEGELPDRFLLLGQQVHVSDKTEWSGVGPDDVRGSRVEVEGRWRGPLKLSAREIQTRSEGRDRIEGRVDDVQQVGNVLELRVMRFVLELPADLELEHEEPLGSIALAPQRAGLPTESRDDDDDLIDGITLGPDLRLGGQIEYVHEEEDELDLDRTDPQDRVDDEVSVRMRLTWEPSDRFLAVAEGRFRSLWRDDDQDGESTDSVLRLGETYGYWRDVGHTGLDLQVGRQDFDDPREWIYDQNLDGVRVIADRPGLRAELSVSTTLSDGSPRDEATDNYVAYLSNNDRRRHLAAWAVHRERDLGAGASLTHVGVRALGRWLPRNDSWLELGAVVGSEGPDDVAGWAFDAGTSWNPRDSRLSFGVGYALGSGDDDPGDGTDHAFRQTGLQDNTDKLAGSVTSVRYYGELVDPELSNLGILTAGASLRLGRKTSLSLLLHHYRQIEASTSLRDTELDMDPDGIDTDLGWEADLVLGSRHFDGWDVELVGSRFFPGDAFDDADDATFLKLQIRYRF